MPVIIGNKNKNTISHTYTQFLKALFSPVKVFNIQKVYIFKKKKKNFK